MRFGDFYIKSEVGGFKQLRPRNCGSFEGETFRSIGYGQKIYRKLIPYSFLMEQGTLLESSLHPPRKLLNLYKLFQNHPIGNLFQFDPQWYFVHPTLGLTLQHSHISRLVCVSGIVTSTSRKQAKATTITVMCRNCFTTKQIHVKPGFNGAQIPQNCDSGGN